MIVSIADIKSNKTNPRNITPEKLEKLKKSISDFPDMLNKRPLVCFTDKDGKYVVLGGNMRLKACEELGIKELPIILADGWTEEQKNEFIIKDNVGFGDWDWDILQNEWDLENLNQWGLNVPFTDDEVEEMSNPENIDTENIFATELDSESNYLVLKFEKDIDWIQAKTIFGLETETARRANGKAWSKGIGRVLNGIEAINLIKNES
jgi:hypothetical protein